MRKGWQPSEAGIASILAGTSTWKGCPREFAFDAVEEFVDWFTVNPKGKREKRTSEEWDIRFKRWVGKNWTERAGDDYRRANGVPLKAAPIKLDM